MTELKTDIAKFRSALKNGTESYDDSSLSAKERAPRRAMNFLNCVEVVHARYTDTGAKRPNDRYIHDAGLWHEPNLMQNALALNAIRQRATLKDTSIIELLSSIELSFARAYPEIHELTGSKPPNPTIGEEARYSAFSGLVKALDSTLVRT